MSEEAMNKRKTISGMAHEYACEYAPPAEDLPTSIILRMNLRQGAYSGWIDGYREGYRAAQRDAKAKKARKHG